VCVHSKSHVRVERLPDPSAARRMKCAGAPVGMTNWEDRRWKMEDRKSEERTASAPYRSGKKAIPAKANQKARKEKTAPLQTMGSVRVPSQKFALADDLRRPPLQKQTEEPHTQQRREGHPAKPKRKTTSSPLKGVSSRREAAVIWRLVFCAGRCRQRRRNWDRRRCRLLRYGE
jgi:hypothetical protein